MRYFCLIAILVTALHCKAEVDTNVTLIYTSGNRVLLVRSEDEFSESRELTSFGYKDQVTALSLHGDYLYALSASETFYHYSFIRRCKITRSSTNGEIIGIDKDHCPDTEWRFHKRASTFVVARDKIYFDDTNNVCAEGICKYDVEFDPYVTGIDYNPADDHFYASWEFGDLMYGRLRNNEAFKKINFGFWKAFTVKVAFDKVWVGFCKKHNHTRRMNSVLWKCSFNYTDGNSTLSGMNCQTFHEYDHSFGRVLSIGATSDHLYVNLENSTYLSRCDPNQIKSCKNGIIKPSGMSGPFVIESSNYTKSLNASVF